MDLLGILLASLYKIGFEICDLSFAIRVSGSRLAVKALLLVTGTRPTMSECMAGLFPCLLECLQKLQLLDHFGFKVSHRADQPREQLPGRATGCQGRPLVYRCLVSLVELLTLGGPFEGALLKAVSDVPWLLQSLRESLSMVPKGDPELGEHVDRVLEALEDCREAGDKNIDFKVRRIPDCVVQDLCGREVTDADYGFIQLAGPDGPLFAEEVRFGLAYQGEQLHYLEHHHVAKELYVVLQGSTDWWAADHPVWEERSWSWHRSDVDHAMITNEKPALQFWSWTGDLELDVKREGISFSSLFSESSQEDA
eukprot:s337_g16.t2